MRNLFRLLYKYSHFFVFLILQGIALMLIVGNNDYQRSSFLNSAGGLTGGIYDWWNGMEDYFSLKEQNSILAAENAELRNELDNAFLIKIRNGEIEVNDTVLSQQYEYVPARVVNRTTTHRNNFFTIEAGSLEGIKPDMGVIGPEGIVGFVRDVSENYATVVIALNEKFKSGGTTKGTNYQGNLEWIDNSPQHLRMKDIPKHARIQVGDSIVTNESSGRYPAGLSIGVVSEVKEKPGSDYQEAILKLSTNFDNIPYVYVVKNLLRTEKEELEAKMNEPEGQP